MDIFEAMTTMRSIRRFRPDPIAEADLRRILQAAISAPSGGNRQTWRFIVVRDAALKRQIQRYYEEATLDLYNNGYLDPPAGATEAEVESYAKRRRGGELFAATLHEAPVIMFACLVRPEHAPLAFSAGGSIYPAVQNMMLAARALGIGSVITTNHLRTHDREIRDLLRIPDDVAVTALIPLGYPQGNFGPLRRNPIEEVCFADRFGEALTLENADADREPA